MDFDDNSLAENSRGSYPIDFIPNASKDNLGPVPQNVIFLTADAFGVMPPIARLTPEQAMYHFLSGYTARVAGTEIGVTEPEATFSTCFGAFHAAPPFGLWQSAEADRQGRGEMLAGQHRLVGRQGDAGRHQAHADQGDTRPFERRAGWQPERCHLRQGRQFRLRGAVAVHGVDSKLLDPRAAWADAGEYDRTAHHLVQLFVDNFAQFEAHVDEGVRAAAPAVVVGLSFSRKAGTGSAQRGAGVFFC
jgi:phosphoenolpyruvate carboxykinase (ATP)